MIVKIWPITYEKGLKRSLEYVNDKEKSMMKDADKILREQVLLEDENEDLKRTFRYVENEDKIKGKYISGYLCNPETVFKDFESAKFQTLLKAGKRNTNDSNIAYHLVQSFPEDLDITDEEVHQCGIELAKKIGVHQAIIASHVHPVADKETGEIHGKCKHNHIIINAYRHPEKLDPRFPNRIKYHSCKETYGRLQLWNDQIALEHGLPIIIDPDYMKSYSWSEKDAKSFCLSWKEHVRMDIDEAIEKTTSWEEYLQFMQANGYTIRDKKYVTYTTPDGKNKVRDYKLGRSYSKDTLLRYWDEKKEIDNEINREVEQNQDSSLGVEDGHDFWFRDQPEISELSPTSRRETVGEKPRQKKHGLDEKESTYNDLEQLVKKTQGPLFVAIPLGKAKENASDFYYLPLDNYLPTDTLKSYFSADISYSICDKSHSSIGVYGGQDIFNLILAQQEKEREKEEQDSSFDERMQRNQECQKREKKKYYEYHLFINSRTGRPYRVGLYDKNGRERSTMELMFILAVVVMKKEDKLWAVENVPEDKINEPYFAKTDWKAQRMMDSIRVAREEGISNLGELDRRINDTGAALSRARAAMKKNQFVKKKMETLYQAVTIYMQNKALVEKILSMPESVEKSEQQTIHQTELDDYMKAKTVMHWYKVSNQEQVDDFIKRYAKVNEGIAHYEQQIENKKEEYLMLKKLKYNAALAEDPMYCYGPRYGMREEQMQYKTFWKNLENDHKKPSSYDHLFQEKKTSPSTTTHNKNDRER